jgi:hypothetical protein
LVEKIDTDTGAGISLIETDYKNSVVLQRLLVNLHAFPAAQLLQAGTVVSALSNEKVVGQGIALFLVDKTCRQSGHIEPGKVCFKPTGMDCRENHSFTLAKRLFELVSPGDAGVLYQFFEAFSMENKDQAEGPGELQVDSAQQAYFRGMIHLGKNRGKIFVGNLYTKRKHNPGKVADGGTKKENDRNRQEIDEKYGTSE